MLTMILTTFALTAEPADLAGTWDVALYFNETAPPSATVMVLEPGDDGALAGSFYGSAFEVARAAERGGVTAFSARTSDGSGAYLHSGRLGEDGAIEGQTFAVGRDFLMLWRAQRRAEPQETETGE